MGGRQDKHKGGVRPQYHPIDPRRMALACRKLARDLRAEAAASLGPISLTGDGERHLITRYQAAYSMDQQAKRWEREVATGVPNAYDRAKIGG